MPLVSASESSFSTQASNSFKTSISGINVTEINETKAAVTSTAVASPEAPPQLSTSHWREQLYLKLEQMKEKYDQIPSSYSDQMVDDLNNREFVRPSRDMELPSIVDRPFTNRPEYHPLAEKTLEKLERVKIHSPQSSSAVKSPENPSAQSISPTDFWGNSQRKRWARHSDKTERIEINLSQGNLPFEGEEKSSRVSHDEEVRIGLCAAALSARSRARAIDALFVSGCFLIFMMIVFFIPEFAFLTKSSFLGMALVATVIVVSYLYSFIALGARTLGMVHEQLQVVNFQGNSLSAQEIGLRAFGYIISLGCFSLGFLWAFFDPEKLTWHDRISKTLIIQNEPRQVNSS